MHLRNARRRFGRCELDVVGLRLLRDGRPVKIQPQPLRMLVALTDRPGDIVTREELRTLIWGDATFVEFDQGLGYCMRQIRLAIGDDATRPFYIETVKGRGYRFIAPVIEESVGDIAPAADSPAAQETNTASTSPRGESTDTNTRRAGGRRPVAVAAAAAVIGLAGVGWFEWPRDAGDPALYTQVTNFTDAAVAPAVSPDGSTIAFIREVEPYYPILGEVYLKRLPGGQSVQLTHDGLPKYGVAFSPDGSEVTYTLATRGQWNTMAVSVLGGEPRLVLSNASGLSWLDAHHVVFSEFVGGLHMGVVTATDTRADLRRIYLPAHERGMAHEGAVSPDRRSVLVVEMGPSGAWQPCRLVPFEGSAASFQVGPPGQCTSATWSPDGAFMYFSGDAGNGSHVWRQRFPHGGLEQVTSGPDTEIGIAMSRDGRRLLTSVGNEESGLWVHDKTGERQLSSEGLAFQLAYSREGREVFYLLAGSGPQRSRELWSVDVASGRSRPVIQGFFMSTYDVAMDGRTVVFGVKPAAGPSEVWLAPMDHSAAPQKLTASGDDAPFFGPDGRILFRASEGHNNYLFEMERDGSHRRKVRAAPIVELDGHSADRRWAVAMVPAEGAPPVEVALIPLDGGAERRVCPATCVVRWSPSGDRVYIQPVEDWRAGAALMFALDTHESLPPLPAGGIGSVADGLAVAGATSVSLPFAGPTAVPGPTPDSFAYTRTVAHRNLFWVALR